MKISINLIEQKNEIIANCPELDINCYGHSKDEAIRRIKSVIHFYITSAKELGLNIDPLEEINIDGSSSQNVSDRKGQIFTDTVN